MRARMHMWRDCMHGAGAGRLHADECMRARMHVWRDCMHGAGAGRLHAGECMRAGTWVSMPTPWSVKLFLM